MELLLHICCAVCLIYPLKVLKEKKFQVKGFFYNPNIHPFSEYRKRKEAFGSLDKNMNLEIYFEQYLPQEFFRTINFHEETKQRCSLCWQLRLEKTAEFACKNNFKYFSTTLLVSPYQDHFLIKEIGERIARDKGISFYYEDFRKGFKEAHQEAKQKGIYCQNYCGCIYSELERWKHSEKP